MIKLYSPAKINLFLRILHKREDGYRELASLFRAVSLFDELTIEKKASDSFSCSLENLSLGKDNLVIRARDAFRQKTGLGFPVHIHLKKNIPIEAGLGGGSSNAATALYALNALSGRTLSDSELALIGSEIGSDVPFFFSNGTAFCTGRGEKMKNLILEPADYTLIKPPFGSSTVLVYQAFQKAHSSSITPEELLNSFQQNQPLLVNDLEPAAFAVNPDLLAFKKFLIGQGYEQVLMSGSGSTFICQGKNELQFLANNWKVRTIQRSEADWYWPLAWNC